MIRDNAKSYNPVFPDTSRKNKNTLYLGGSGCGKSQAVISNKDIKQSKRVIIWDANGDHDGEHAEDRKVFLMLLSTALKTNSKFRVGFCGSTFEDFEFFCGVVWAVLDGRFETHVIVEELSHVCKSVGKASANAARLLNQGRKYGLVFHGVSQKPQEISKTFFDQCERKYIGRFYGDNALKMAKYLGLVSLSEKIKRLDDLEFLYDDGRTTGEPKVCKFKYKKPKEVSIIGLI